MTSVYVNANYRGSNSNRVNFVSRLTPRNEKQSFDMEDIDIFSNKS
jgi:hypothetical protein